MRGGESEGNIEKFTRARGLAGDVREWGLVKGSEQGPVKAGEGGLETVATLRGTLRS